MTNAAEDIDGGALGFTAHEWGVLAPLALVGFFLNYDTGLLSLAGPAIARGLGVTIATFGIAVAIIRVASLGSVVTLRLADRSGRRTVLLLSVVGFSAATGATALAWGVATFVVFQLVARLFLATEETLAGVVLTEELRPDRRGAGIGLLGIISMSGFGMVALLLLAVDATPLGWRIFYVAALVPLGVVAYLRRNLRETSAFAVADTEARLQRTLLPVLDDVDRHRLIRLALVHGSHGLANTATFFYAAELAQTTYGWKGLFTVIVIAAGPATLAGYVAGGRVSDRVGRRPVMAMGLLAFSVGTVLIFSGGRAVYAPAFFVLAAADACLQAARSSYTSELFPTEIRATVASYIGAVSVAAGSVGLVLTGGLASVVSPETTLIALAAVSAVTVLVLRSLPETAGDDISHRPAVAG
jgi:putative MFS transporter